MRKTWAIVMMLPPLAACGVLPAGEFEVVYVDAPQFCRAKVQAYSDFAYLRPSEETIVGNDCGEDWDALGDGPAIWTVAADAPNGFTKASDQKRVYTQPFRRGQADMLVKLGDMKKLLAAAKEHPQRTVKIIGYASLNEPKRLAEKRAAGLRDWLVKEGLDASRIAIAPVGSGASKAEAEIIVSVRGGG